MISTKRIGMGMKVGRCEKMEAKAEEVLVKNSNG